MTDFCIGEAQHLAGFLAYCRAADCLRFIRKKPYQFAAFARVYNGPNYAAQGYDTKLAGSYSKALKSAPAPPAPIPAPRTDPLAFAATLQRGSSGPYVMQIQKWLGATGFMITGTFADETDQAVRAFQSANGLSDDGVVGKLTWRKLRNVTPAA